MVDDTLDPEAFRTWIKRITQELSEMSEAQRDAAIEAMRRHVEQERQRRLHDGASWDSLGPENAP